MRELLTAEKRDAGPQIISWDGRDRYGEPLPPGKYGWKAILFNGMGSRFYGSVGSSGRPPYRTPDGLGAIGGQHGEPGALAADSTGIYMAGGAEEGQPAMRKIDPQTGAALWKRSMGGFGSALAAAAHGEQACFLNLVNNRAGRFVDLVQIDPKTGTDLKAGNATRVRLPFVVEAEKPVPVFPGLAIANGHAYFSLPQQNAIGRVELKTGKILPDIPCPTPQGLTRVDDTTLLVCSGKQVLKLNLTDGSTSPLLHNLTQARAVARDAAGNTYVSDLGISQQIKKFSPDGKLLAAWGIAGGKPATMVPYQPMAFQNVSGIVLGPDGNLWLSESFSSPKRFIKISTDGRWLEDFYGPVAYNAFGPDLDDVSRVFFNTGGGHGGSARVVQARVNYEKYAANPRDPAAAWQVEAIHDLSLGADGKSPNGLLEEVASTGYGHFFTFTAKNGKRYLFRPSKANRAATPPGAGLWVQEKERWIPAAFISRASTAKTPVLSWADTNGDGLVQEGERYATDPVQEVAWIDRDLTLQGFRGTLTAGHTNTRGVPDYRGGVFTPYLSKGETDYHEGWTFVSPLAGEAVYYIANAGADRHLSFWDRASDNRLMKVEKGRVQWIVGQHSPKPDLAQFSTSSGIAGIVDDILLAQNVEPANYLAFTTDGLVLGNVIVDDEGKRPAVGPNAINIESFTGLFLKDPRTGKRLLFSVSSGDDRILEITGPGQTTRLNGEITLDTTRPRQNENTTTQIAYENWVGENQSGFGIDGEEHEWPQQSSGVPIVSNGVLIGDVRLRRDDGHLHVLANIMDSTPLESGEGVELDLAKPEGGSEYRILFTGQQDSKGKWKGLAKLQKDGGDIATPNAETAVALRWRSLGYRLEAKIPLALMPELTAPRAQPTRRVTKSPGQSAKVNSEVLTLPDLIGPLRLKATVIRLQNGTTQQARWPIQGWGTVSVPN